MMKMLLSLALGTLALMPTVNAAPVSFWFAGTVDSTNNPGNTLPAGIAIGTPFYGRITYDAAHLTYSNLASFTNGGVGDHYFRQTTGFAFVLQIGGHTVTNQEIKNFQWAGSVHIYDGYNNADEIYMDIGQNGLVTDGQPDTNSLVNFYLRDGTKTALSSIALPSQPPALAAFANSREFTWTRYDADAKTLFSIGGTITHLTTNQLVALNIRRAAADGVRLAWPSVVAGGTLQCLPTLGPTNWQAVTNAVVDLGMEHTVTLPADSSSKFFRLAFP